MNGYKKYKNVTKEVLDTIKVGNLVKVNDWKRPMKVVGVSDNYFVMKQNNFGKLLYSVCEKKPWEGIQFNRMIGGMFHCGRDNTIFGWMGTDDIKFDYKFEDENQINSYLKAFETRDIELSQRGSIAIKSLYVK